MQDMPEAARSAPTAARAAECGAICAPAATDTCARVDALGRSEGLQTKLEGTQRRAASDGARDGPSDERLAKMEGGPTLSARGT